MLPKIDPVIIKTLNSKFENVSFTKLTKKILTIKQNKFVGGSSDVPRDFLGIPGICIGTRTLTKVLESAPSDRQTVKSWGSI